MTTFTGEPCPRSSDFLQAARDYDQQQNSATSHSAVTSSINRLAGIGLVGASTGYGCVFAYHNSISQGWPLAFVAVTFAASLEIIKPQAFAAAITKGREVSARVALGLLAIAACLYSLTAELQLTAMSRGDTVAARSKTITDTKDAARARQLLETELANLPTTQSADIAAKVAALLAANPKSRCDLRPGDDDYGGVSKKVCPTIEALSSQQAAAEKAASRRAELTEALSAPATTATDGTPAVDKADPGASALSAYLAVLGVSVKPEAVAEWLVLVPVVALELGSLFAGLLVAPSSTANLATTRGDHGNHGARRPTTTATTATTPATTSERPQTLAATTSATSDGDDVIAGVRIGTIRATTANEVCERLKGYLTAKGGAVTTSRRKMAETLSTKPSTLSDAVESMENAGILSAESTRKSTVYRLATMQAAA